MSPIEPLWVDMETELGETWGRVGDIEVLQACLPGCRLLLMLRKEQRHIKILLRI